MLKRSVDNLSDVELHKKLLEYGLPSVAITETTRPLLIKKLKQHIQTTRRSAHSNTHATNPTRYSLAANNSSSSYPYRNTTLPATPTTPSSDSAYHVPLVRDCTLRNTRSYLNNTLAARCSTTNSDSEDDALYAGATRRCTPHFGVVGRLLNLRDSTLQYKQPAPVVSNEAIEYANKRIFAACKTAHPAHTPQTTVWQRLKALGYSWRGFKQLHIPHAIILIFVLFLVVIASVYLFKNPDLSNLIREGNIKYVVCGQQNAASRSLQHCVDSERVETALAYSRALLQLLQQQAVQHYCVNSSLPQTLSTREFIQHMLGQSGAWDMRQVLRDFQASVYMIKQNPNWQVLILEPSGQSVSPTQLYAYVAQADTRFALLKPRLPLSCVLYNKLQRFFLIIGIGVLVLGLGLLVYVAFRHIRNLQQERQTAVGNFCTEIVNELLYQASLNEAPEAQSREVILNHLRDKLIPLNKRARLLWAWQEALRLLEHNESRIQFGITMRNGEEFRCVRWTGSLVPDSRELSFRKQWQSPAFDNANRICNPPTPCLKIRHMFDSSEVKHPNLKKVIEEAIFEKVGSRCNILDIQLDTQSCCVYVRCASEEDAGIVHNEINGWWFDKRLVSIKFLRLERYLSRFPESA